VTVANRGVTIREHIFKLLAVGALLAASWHVLAATGVLRSVEGVIWRHWLFVGIDIIVAGYFLKRPLWALPIFVILVVQQTVSHGARAIRIWQDAERVDWLSFLDLAGIFLAFALLMVDARARLAKRGQQESR
jgi:hypothetical protein